MDTALAVREASEITSRGMTPAQLDLLKRTICKGATDDEFSLFTMVCQRTGLDPFMKQIHAVFRWDKAADRKVMSIQVAIDGYRLIADRTGKYAGNDDPVFEGSGEHPEKATVTVWKLVGTQRCPFTATARWSEYAPKKDEFMWTRMPFLMLGKVAEALALRKAFPAELSGMYTPEEMAQAGPVIDGEIVAHTEAAPATAPMVPTPDVGGDVLFCTPAQVKAIYAIGRETGIGLEGTDALCQREYHKNPAQLTKREASEFIDQLRSGPMPTDIVARVAGETVAADAPPPAPVNAPAVQERRKHSREQLIRSWRKGYERAEWLGLAPSPVVDMEGGDSDETIETRIRDLAAWIKRVEATEWPALYSQAKSLGFDAGALGPDEDIGMAVAMLQDRLPKEGEPADDDEPIEVPF